MKVGDLVGLKRNPKKILGIVIRIFEIENKKMHVDPLPMAEIMTSRGPQVWKRKKLELFK